MMKMKTIIFGLAVVLSVSACEAKGNKTTAEKADAAVNSKTKNSDDKHGNVVYLTAESFKEQVFDYENNKEWKYKGELPAIIDFYADWCGPCRMIAPILEELSETYDGQLVVYKIDTDKQRELAGVFGIRSLPTVVFVPVNGQPQASMGAMPKESFEKAINEILLQD